MTDQFPRDVDPAEIRARVQRVNDLADLGWRVDFDLGAYVSALIAVGRDVTPLLAEVERLRRIVKLTTELTHDTDGESLDPDTDIPVGEVMRALAGEPL